MNLTQNPEVVNWPETHYVYLEKVGPFQDTAPKAWQELHQFLPKISEHNKVTGFMSLYKVAPKIYRAGVSVDAAPKNLPTGLQYANFRWQVQQIRFDRTVFATPRSIRPRFPHRGRKKDPGSR